VTTDVFRCWEISARVAQDLYGGGDALATMATGSALAVELVPGCDAATITVRRETALSTAIATTDKSRQVDELQYELNQGPCRDATLVGETVTSPAVGEDHRWPTWGPRAAELGIGAVMSVPLAAPSGLIQGALNLYAGRPAAHDEYARVVALSIAAQIGVAAAAATEISQRTAGMAGRTVIGQAQGLLMERYGLSADQAFDLLVRTSQNSNTKVRQIAAEVVATRELPGRSRRDAALTAEQSEVRRD
jgi:GAF domain-containing protein